MARDRQPGPVAVAMTGGHGEWFVQRFDAEGLPLSSAESLAPAQAVAACGEMLVAGSQAEALVAARRTGTAMPLWLVKGCIGLSP